MWTISNVLILKQFNKQSQYYKVMKINELVTLDFVKFIKTA